MSTSQLRRKASPEIIARKSTSSTVAPPSASNALSAALAPSFGSRTSAVAQIHRSLKAWRDEDKSGAEPAGGKSDAADEKLDEGSKPAQAAGGSSSAGKSSAALDPSADKKGAPTSSSEGEQAAAGEAAPAAASDGGEVKEEAPPVGTKRILAKRKDLSEAQAKAKEEERNKQKELCLAKVELAAAKAEQLQKAVDLVAGLGFDALLTLAGPAAPVIAPILRGAINVAKDGVNLGLDTKREVQSQVQTMAINTMSHRQIKILANNWTRVEPSLTEIDARVQPQIEQLRAAGLAGGSAGALAAVGAAAKGAASEGGKKVAESFIEKWVPFIGTLRSIAELVATVNEVASLREKIEQLEEELS